MNPPVLNTNPFNLSSLGVKIFQPLVLRSRGAITLARFFLLMVLIGSSYTIQSQQPTSATTSAIQQYRAERDHFEALKLLNTGLRNQLSKQQMTLSTLDDSIASVENVAQQIPYLMEKMLTALEQFIALDMPFHFEQRVNQVAIVRASMDDPDISISDKFRAVLSLYQAENDYGRTRETYPHTIVIEAEERDVNILRVGRIALVYQTTDTLLTGAWDRESGLWVGLEASEYRIPIQKAIKVAKGLVAPEIVILPINASR